jgi:hypothetical protein
MELGDNASMFKASKVTGSVRVAWKGKGGNTPAENKLVFASFEAQESVFHASKNKYSPPKGSFLFSVFKDDYTPEREITASVIDVGFDKEAKKAWFFAEVISDTKCDASDHSGCSDTDHTEGGCSHDDSTHDGGCSHDTGTDSADHDSGGGCSHDDTGSTDHDSGGGCSHDDTGSTDHDSGGGCSHDDTGSTDHDSGGGCSHDDTDSATGCDHDDGSHDTGSGGKPDDKGGKGKQCRVGQYVVAKMHDKGSPGTNDGITWKWFINLDGFTIDGEPKNLCKKEILDGNLTVHIRE